MSDLRVQTLALVGSYVPRQCGIATFTKDLRDALMSDGDVDVPVLAMDDNEDGYSYPDEVRFEIRANVLKDYQLATDYLNINQIDAVIVQHEFGLYGARSGENILKLIRNTRMPVITTLHTVLSEPNKDQAVVMAGIVAESDRLVVMSEQAVEILTHKYNAPARKISVVPHGIPDVPFSDSLAFKPRFGLEGKTVLMTFGLLSPGKGIETVIQALPQIVRENKDIVYVVVGAIHPHVLKREGNSYLILLERLAEKLGVREHLIFHNRYVTKEELSAYLGAADIYITPYPNKDQITSGTLAYAMGAGKAVISTPFLHAGEMLADQRGRLFPFNDSDALARTTIELLRDKESLNQLRQNAYRHCRSMTWNEAGLSYQMIAQEVLHERQRNPRVNRLNPSSADLERVPGLLPDLKLDHLRTLTDDTGILQHAIYTVPNRLHGYCTDDNARALVATMLHWELTQDDAILPLGDKYLSFLHFAYDPDRRHFRNFLSYDRRWKDELEFHDDVLGRSLWALGTAVAVGPNEGTVALASRMFCAALGTMEAVSSPRACAFTLVGIHAYLKRFSGDSFVRRMREILARRLFDLFKAHGSSQWPWCENKVTYDNATLLYALILSGQWLPDPAMIEQGLCSLRWLLEQQTDERGRLNLIGNRGWMERGGARAKFDQQPIDAMALVAACAEAYRHTKDAFWMRKLRWCLDWFLGNNVTESVVYDSTTGGCRDGLYANGANQNEGAESTLAWLISLLTINRLQQEAETGAFEKTALLEMAVGS
ncbi:MAG TPA: glycosyltransferase family 4 protein [Planctomycetota bacterium]|nr:glycosyltransferase family 4 protein [Planctomycetota bacterium]